MRLPVLLLLPLALAACDVRATGDGNGSGDNVHLTVATPEGGGNRVKVNVPGFSADVKLPNLDFGGHMDIDGVKAAPDTKVLGMDVAGDDRGGIGRDGGGRVHFTFTNPQAPGRLIDYYARSLADAGYTVNAVAGGTAVQATKGAKRFELAIAPDAGGSRGTIDVTGD